MADVNSAYRSNEIDAANRIASREALLPTLNPIDQLRVRRDIENLRTPIVESYSRAGLQYGTANQPINLAGLEGQVPLNLPDIQRRDMSASILSDASARVEGYKSNLQREQELALNTAKTDTNSAREGLFRSVGQKLGILETRPQIEEEFGIQQKKEVVDELQAALEKSQRAHLNELRAIEGQGLTDVQNIARTREINRQYAFEQADTMLIADIAERRLSRAKEAADRKLKLLLEPIEFQLEYEKMFYEENKDILSKAEQREFDVKLKADERNYNEIKSYQKTLQEAKLSLLTNASQQNAPFDVLNAIQSAKTPEEAIVAAGQYGGNILERQIKEAQLAKAYKDIENVQKNPKKTEAQSKAGGYAQRMIESQQIIDQIGDKFIAPENYLYQYAPNVFKSADRQKFEQAQRNFINAVLRRESGAVISPDEFDNARQQYFPQPGDTKEVLEQKRQNRITSTNSLLAESGTEQIPYIVNKNQDPLNIGVNNNPLGI